MRQSGRDPDEIVLGVSRALGFKATSPGLREVIVAQIDGLLASGTLAAKGDMLTVPAPVRDLQPAGP